MKRLNPMLAAFTVLVLTLLSPGRALASEAALINSKIYQAGALIAEGKLALHYAG